MHFKASLDTLSKSITAVICVFSVVFIMIAFTVLKDESMIVLLPVFTMILVVLFTWLFSPQGYEITNDHIEIIRKVNSFRIARNEILSIEKLSNDDMGRAWRMMGNGGMFGYTGWFRSGSQGTMRWFVTQRKNYVAIVLNNHKKYILSPDDADGFIQATQW
jgi:hypothetical protein